MAYALHGLGDVALKRGDYAQARTYYQESLVLRREIGDSLGIATSQASVDRVTVLGSE